MRMPRYVPKLSREEMERRRLAAGKELLEADPDEWGYQARIAREYGVHPSNVCRWEKRVREGGLDALRSTKAKGNPPRLTDEQRERLRGMLLEGAVAHGYETDLWTGKRVARLIERTFGVGYSEKYVPQLLREQLGFSWQKPARRPRELDPDRVEEWLRETWAPAERGRSKADGP
jgi:transposase